MIDMKKNNSDKIKELQKKNQENQRKYTKKREDEEKKANQLVHQMVSKIDANPHDYHHYYDLATLLVEGKDYEQAEELLMKALGIFDQSSEDIKDTLKFGLGNVYYAAQEYDRAIKIFQEINDDKLQAEAYIMLAQSYMAKGDNKRAMVFALSAQSTRQKDPAVNEMIGDNLLALGNFSQAAEFYDLVLTAEPQNGRANFNRGLVAMVADEPFESYFKRANQYDPAYFNKGQKKLKDIEKFIQLNGTKKAHDQHGKKD
ncbi:tetratricopeptide repeat protein [Lentilactobacillus hilgardii]|uniref:Tetratricopeptide repeat protein n=1 Tax=Lentilactobacillus hilgardii (strain ATCC 8290 / DSM 20176 / CCUG 30140 / JCM 1155 / KCTC 3500 / NBRC 15886 / NCIMB 8040 / NRRL B-1843 / 9) TaxID=1423757 RepID=C0XKM4_LENH9|nr:tetratricopeptide repeat protein [Lentilactobacillus hilgardii DSM 20176 = ATCC 8290]MCP9332742.1 tetratricopeptide repeat protein [Lentilactobacillus hilgardii]KRK57969.1 TPR repeat-containing protein [Lentilactobacillus hilgardii DSM 20176 = ATCC 8290]MCP9349351.1 tetratricopeptide repeat protein [Lentilactobacillus hilgardii]MCP9352270.1 tetratricopeptide repeat protein [Lentilactobacillus hilgardii]